MNQLTSQGQDSNGFCWWGGDRDLRKGGPANQVLPGGGSSTARWAKKNHNGDGKIVKRRAQSQNLRNETETPNGGERTPTTRYPKGLF